MLKSVVGDKNSAIRSATTCILRHMLLLFAIFPAQAALLYAGGPQPLVITDGLPHVNVYDVLQDSRGLLWVATENGLCSYDGTVFHNYTVSDGLPSNRVMVLSPDAQGNIWVGTQQGVCIWRDSKVQYTLRAGFPLDVHRILHAYPYVYMLTAHRKLHTYDVRSQSFVGTMPLNIELISPRSEGGIWALSYNGLYYMQGAESHTYAVPDIEYPKLFALLDRGDELLLNYNHSLLLFGKKTKEIRLLQTSEPFVMGYNQHMYADSHGAVWVWSINDNGVVHRLGFRGADSADVELMASNTLVTRFYEDHSGDMWFATYGSGICLYRNDPYRNRILPGNVVSLYAGNNLTLIGTNTGLYSLSPSKLVKIPLNVTQEHIAYIRKIVFYKDVFYVANSSVITEMEPQQSSMLGSVTEVPARAMDIFDGRLLLATMDGRLQEYIPGRKGLTLQRETVIPFPKEFTGSVKDLGSWSNYYLAATTNGVYVYTKELKYAGHLLPGFNVFCIYAATNRVMFGTSEGLYTLAADGAAAVRTESVLAADAIVYSYAEILESCMAFGTSKGILILKGPEAYLIDGADHMFAGHIYAIAYDKQSRILTAGANNGVFRIPYDPEDDTRWKQGPAVYITSLHLSRQLRTDSLAGVSIQYDNREGMDIAFTTLGQFGGLHPRYRYSFDGQPMQYTGSGNLVFNSLEPGLHSLLIQASANGAEWGPELKLQVDVYPFWYQQWWFRLLCILLVLGFTVLLTIFIMRAYNRRRMLYAEYYQLQLRINRAKNIPHYTSNVLSILEYLILKGDTTLINRFFVLFNRFNTLTLCEAQQILRPLKDELEYVDSFLNLEKFRLSEEFLFELDIAANVDQEFPVPNMIIHTLVENAVKHGIIPRGGGGMIRIQLRMQDAALYIVVEDNGPGPGIQSTGKGSGFGLKMLREQLELLQKQRLLYGFFAIEALPAAAGTHCTLLLSKHKLHPVTFS